MTPLLEALRRAEVLLPNPESRVPATYSSPLAAIHSAHRAGQSEIGPKPGFKPKPCTPL